MSSSEPSWLRIAPDVKLGNNVRLAGFVNFYGCEIWDDVKIGTLSRFRKGPKSGIAARFPAAPSPVKA
jgi:hypothetical protein